MSSTHAHATGDDIGVEATDERNDDIGVQATDERGDDIGELICENTQTTDGQIVEGAIDGQGDGIAELVYTDDSISKMIFNLLMAHNNIRLICEVLVIISLLFS
ncbi:unnamed protein product [Adineta steineri]|uniref:Uncharacterized protein n=1 Tax=Adineta steineri TaxID=433720 RepID=A0A813X6J5_9BILA|nr:unnamed protein product [Adineta steineri]CAF0865368.1 unnamed protein product [Adineta steineri]CAF0931145.1 unnamed protein product [Adineta steineri]